MVWWMRTVGSSSWMAVNHLATAAATASLVRPWFSGWVLLLTWELNTMR